MEDDAEGEAAKQAARGSELALRTGPTMMRGKSPRATGQPGASSSAAPDAQGGAKKRRAAPSLFGSRPKKPKGSTAATKRDEAAAKAIRFRKAVTEPLVVSA